MCERCGSETNNKEIKAKFKCSACKDLKIERKLLKPLVKKVRDNFRKLKEEYSFLKNLYIFGSYAEKNLKCCDIDLLIIFNGDLLDEFIETKLRNQREEIWDEFELEEDFEIIVDYLDKTAFFDFRKCQEYPDGCLDCSEQEGCNYNVKYWRERPNYCLTECKYARIPPCMNLYDSICNWHDDWDLGEAQRLFLEGFQEKVKNGADKSFKVSNLEVKVLHLLSYTSIEEFHKRNKNLSFKLKLIE
ncbi:hypothetical protein ES703_90300 [subsurface metagenome]